MLICSEVDCGREIKQNTESVMIPVLCLFGDSDQASALLIGSM